MTCSILWLVLCLSQADGTPSTGVITGTAFNASNGESPLVGATVVLRANLDGGFEPIAETQTDDQGRFSFNELPVVDDLVYLPGVNHDDVHYPGPRVRLTDDRPSALIRILAYDAVESPSPLVCRRADFDLRPGDGYLEITETLLLANPGRTAYIGEQLDDRPAVTLRLSLPAGFDKVTFDKEALGRSFLLHDNDLLTSLPWPPGEREVKFRYRLPVESSSALFERTVDLVTDQATVRVRGKSIDQVSCSLATSPIEREGALIYEHRGGALAAGQVVQLRIGALPLTVDTYARWGALALLGVLICGAVVVARRRQSPSADVIPFAAAKGRSARTGRATTPDEGATPRNMPSRSETRRRRRAA